MLEIQNKLSKTLNQLIDNKRLNKRKRTRWKIIKIGNKKMINNKINKEIGKKKNNKKSFLKQSLYLMLLKIIKIRRLIIKKKNK